MPGRCCLGTGGFRSSAWWRASAAPPPPPTFGTAWRVRPIAGGTGAVLDHCSVAGLVSARVGSAVVVVAASRLTDCNCFDFLTDVRAASPAVCRSPARSAGLAAAPSQSRFLMFWRCALDEFKQSVRCLLQGFDCLPSLEIGLISYHDIKVHYSPFRHRARSKLQLTANWRTRD